jgi:hypothetical protein
MSVAFGISIENETWLESASENSPSYNLLQEGIWEKLEAIADERGLAQLSRFIYEDPQEASEALDYLDEIDEEQAQALREHLHSLEDQPEWFSSSDAGFAAQTINGLIEHLREQPDAFDGYGEEAVGDVLADLEDLSKFLLKIKEKDLQFRFWIG